MSRITCVLSVCIVACAVEPKTAVEVSAIDKCDDFLCTGNSPILGGYFVWQLDETGTTPFEGFRIRRYYNAVAELHRFDVVGARPQVESSGGILRDDELVGMTFELDTPQGVTPLRIVDYRPVSFYDGGPGPAISGYRLQYPKVDPVTHTTVWTDLCPYETLDDRGLASTWALLSQGDRFDKASTTIIATGPGVAPWFNIGCAGDVISKLVRMRHAYAVDDPAHHTQLQQRRAALNMFTAKYCPGNELYTVFGKPLTWEDHAGWTKIDPVRSYEAIWTASGAYCLRTRRAPELGALSCNVQDCTDDMIANWHALGGLLSGNPM